MKPQGCGKKKEPEGYICGLRGVNGTEFKVLVKMDNLCANCGHDECTHSTMGYGCHDWTDGTCSCEKFTPQSCGKVSDFKLGGIKNWISLQEDKEIVMEVFSFAHKKILAMEDYEKISPSCSNNSPQTKPKGVAINIMSEAPKSEVELQRVREKVKTEDTKTLSSKMTQKIDRKGYTENIYQEEDVREAVQKLKEKIKGYRTATYNMKFLRELDREIDKIFGEELSK